MEGGGEPGQQGDAAAGRRRGGGGGRGPQKETGHEGGRPEGGEPGKAGEDMPCRIFS
jgi:hypothetical protein